MGLDARQKEELSRRWVLLVTHTDSQRNKVRDEALGEFRGQLKAHFPKELEQAVDNTIFIENANDKSDYGKWKENGGNQDRILRRVLGLRQIYHSVYDSPALDTIQASALENALRHGPKLWDGVRSMDKHGKS